MIEALPIKLLTDTDAPIFGNLNVALGKLARVGLPVASSIVVTPPHLKLKTILEHYDFGSKEVFEQSLTLVKKEINSIPVPQILEKETKKHKNFLLNGEVYKGTKSLWQALLQNWIEEIKRRIWHGGFYPGVTEDLNPQVVTFTRKLKSFGKAFFDPLQDDVVIKVDSHSLHPMDQKQILEIVNLANKKLFIPKEYEWILDNGIKLSRVLPYTPVSSTFLIPEVSTYDTPGVGKAGVGKGMPEVRSVVKVFLDLSTGFTIEKNVDGVYIDSGKICNLEKPQDSFENLVFKLVESAISFPMQPVLFKLADIAENQGKIRGALRLLHQKSLLDPLIDALDFARHKKNLLNVHIVVPFVRSLNEFLQLKRNLAVKKLSRKRSMQLWLEICVPENIINLEQYLLVGLDGVVINLDELIAHLNGFDVKEENLAFYKYQVDGLIKFLEDGVKLLHKSKIRFLATGSIVLNTEVLHFLIDKGVYGVVIERYEVHSVYGLLNQVEKRIILRRSS
ncbi:hypothetical protein A3C26_01785 [Candidatus Daviesbacteria bacterium RIFCSPHIGHO2_02_FULL_39_12]|uniref:PEP-utilising enzyme C-terminal domain-containing protein n=2 Tax=Candidatus Daviesiibacteriota TaxID=1752718 RepID=A0A1F5JAL3_9BACT|nr:MAG: hypothetical protein A3C26_01785 [Candidatus Daviesbacteria bacterium RIFCSPHIGHO2_02_FULL_39_12]OGE72705.1 MAG: hypothetical protein A3H40_00110 [Candidatus Daviesbacteria bacterium RIFCSPLOWO2_02_FULL_38_15]